MGDKIQLDDNRGGEYEVTDSEDNYSEEEKELLKEVRRGRDRDDVGNKKQLMQFADSDDEEGDDDEEDDDDDVGQMMGESDIEGASDDDDLPDSKNWGSKASAYYNTDFVDPDFDSYTAEQEEMAKAEEDEAKIIQLRLAKQMGEDDFMFGLPAAKGKKGKKESKVEEEEPSIKIKADFAGLSQREKQQLFSKDAPEFAGLVSDFQQYSEELKSLVTPVLDHVEKNQIPIIPALQFARTYQNIALSYCSNIAFYMLLKAKRMSIRTHPLTKRLVELKQLLTQLQDKYENIIKPQLEALLERIVDGDVIEVVLPVAKPLADKIKKRTKLDIMAQYTKKTEKSQDNGEQEDEDDSQEGSSSDEDEDKLPEDGKDDEEEEELGEDEEDARRGITYQIAKNKGLTPHRKKELRNPRVKHRGKFRKALIRRKGAVRTVRTETKRYGGEISGIKATVSKSIKFKS